MDDKRALYRDLLIAMHGWHDGIMSLWRSQSSDELAEARETAYRFGIEAGLIASPLTLVAIKDARRGLFAVQTEVVLRQVPPDVSDPLAEVKERLVKLENALRAELSSGAEQGDGARARAAGA
ncbi:hypothetical protein [Streptomyces malaysiensis]|uniref:Uncharacterized protein n=1 Tax=Streptomyces malaysiensis subsp. samsunensis TaxID=459658 RepID=A0A9X2RZ34_STRMQ|nr:hypothetical protein [Streptomyces samsunensis]MCQ8835798.1 hypothetical protein [Streptomyces samsunensis]